LFTPRYSWNTSKVDVKHQSINQSINVICSLSFKKSLSRSWSHSSICNKCPTPLKFWLRIPLMAAWVYSIQDYVIKVCKWLVAGQWFSLGTPVFPTNKTDRHYITEILLTVALNTITLILTPIRRLYLIKNVLFNLLSICFKMLQPILFCLLYPISLACVWVFLFLFLFFLFFCFFL